MSFAITSWTREGVLPQWECHLAPLLPPKTGRH